MVNDIKIENDLFRGIDIQVCFHFWQSSGKKKEEEEEEKEEEDEEEEEQEEEEEKEEKAHYILGEDKLAYDLLNCLRLNMIWPSGLESLKALAHKS